MAGVGVGFVGGLLLRGWRRLQGVVFRRGDARFEGRNAADAVAAALSDPDAVMVNRNAGSGTRLLVDGLLNGESIRVLVSENPSNLKEKFEAAMGDCLEFKFRRATRDFIPGDHFLTPA